MAQGGQRRFSYFNIKRDNSLRLSPEQARGLLGFCEVGTGGLLPNARQWRTHCASKVSRRDPRVPLRNIVTPPNATAVERWRLDAPRVQLSGNCTDTGDTLGPQVIHDGPRVRPRFTALALTAATACLLPTCLSERACAIGVAQLHATRIGGSKGGLERSLIRPASNSATRGHLCQKRPIAPGGTCGRSLNTRSTTLATRGAQQVHIAREPVELGEHHGCPEGLRVSECLGKLGTVRLFTALRAKSAR